MSNLSLSAELWDIADALGMAIFRDDHDVLSGETVRKVPLIGTTLKIPLKIVSSVCRDDDKGRAVMVLCRGLGNLCIAAVARATKGASVDVLVVDAAKMGQNPEKFFERLQIKNGNMSKKELMEAIQPAIVARFFRDNNSRWFEQEAA